MDHATLFFGAGLAIYVVASRSAMRLLKGGAREVVMALLNVGGGFMCFFCDPQRPGYISHLFRFYLFLVVFQYVMLRTFSGGNGWRSWLAFFTPILSLIILRYVPNHVFVRAAHTFGKGWIDTGNLVGISYLAFRCSRLVLEVRNGSVKMPGLWQYLSFAFFLPTQSLGPINTYANFRRGFEAMPWEAPIGGAALRILVGWVKYQFLGGVFSVLAYQGLLHDNHLHHWMDLPVAMVFYYLYLYCNFSGFCDMVIGAAALVGIPVLENFNNPMAARNMRDFWNRWHITLSQWMRDIVFAPLSKLLVRVMGPALANHAIAIAITVVFLLVGIWHGTGWNFVLFGAAQALGLVVTHYYTIFLKKRLGREGFKSYNENRWIHAVAVAVTFAYFSATTLFFANTLPDILSIFPILR